MSKFTHIQLVLAILIAISNKANSFTKYGRGCQDIGCLPNEVCVMAQDSCNLGQRDGKECGTYPTCKRTGAAKPPDSTIQHKPTFNTNANADNNSPYGGSNSGNTQTNSGLYPSLPNQNNMQGGGYNPGVNPGGYVPPGYNPSQGGGQPPYYGNGGYQPPPNNNGGNRPAYGGGGSGGYSGGAGGYSGGAGGYSGGGGYNRGGYSDPSGGQKEKGNGLLSGILSNPHVSSAISGIIAGQIQKAITGRNEPNQPNRGGYNDGYGGGGGSSGSSGSSGASNLIGGLISGYLSGGGSGGSSQNRGGGSGGGLGFLGDLIGGGSNQRSGGGGGGGGAISDFFSSKSRGGLFSENPSSNTNSHQQYSSGKKDYPTQPPYNYNYNYNG